MRKAFLFVNIIFLAFVMPFVSASTIYAANCSFQAVNASINSANATDSVIIPAGTCTWNHNLNINKGVVLQGAGAGNTTIISNYTASSYLIVYAPTNFTANNPFRITGFTFDLQNKSYGIRLDHTKSLSLIPQTKIRIDHNRFTGLTISSKNVLVNDGMRGVVDNNFFDNNRYPIRAASAAGNNGQNWWNSTDVWKIILYGEADNNMYFENNIFTGIEVVSDCQYANRYIFRYNTINLSYSAYPLFDMHGNQGPGYMYACFGGEMYGNIINGGTKGGCLLDQRAGKVLVFNNNIVTTSSFSPKIREEFDDSLNPTSNTLQPQRPSDSYYWNNLKNNLTLIKTSVPISDSGIATGGGNNYLEDLTTNFSYTGYTEMIRLGIYITGGTGAGQYRLVINTTNSSFGSCNATFGSPPPCKILMVGIKNSTGKPVELNWTVNPDSTSQYSTVADCCNSTYENHEFFNQNTSFDGKAGIGCGVLASRPATCTTGVGYWATTQSCTDLTGLVGANPTTPINGTLYKCTSTNTWTAYFTPYIYPHPLTQENYTAPPDTTPPQITIVSPLNQTYSTTTISFNVSANENLGACRYTLNNWVTNYTMTVAGTKAGHVNSTMSQGSKTAKFWCNDTSGNINNTMQVTFSIFIDTTPPSLSITYPANTTYTTNVTELKYTASDTNLQACWYSLNSGQTNTSITCGTNATGLSSSEGSNTWKVWANDSYGNKNLSSVTFYKNTTTAGGNGLIAQYLF